MFKQRYDDDGKKCFEGPNAWVALSKTFTNICNDPNLQNTYLLIDALDECTTDLDKLLDLIVEKALGYSRIRWILSSRNWPDIEKGLHEATQQVQLRLELNEESVSASITRYVQSKVESVGKAKRIRPWHTRSCPTVSVIERKWHLSLGRVGLILAVVSVVHRPISLSELETLVEMPPRSSGNDKALKEIVGHCGSFLTLQERTVSFVHQSAKDFLLEKACHEIFPSGQEKVHHDIFSRSLRALSATLRRDIYSLGAPGYHIDQVRQPDPDPLVAVRYSCVYWIDHLHACSPSENTKDDLKEGGLIYEFLRHHFLHWLEALSLLHGISKGILSIARLRDLLGEQIPESQVLSLVQDAMRFIFRHGWVIEHTPLQAYVSALIFSPEQSKLRTIFKDEEPPWILSKPVMEVDWDACLQTLEGHNNSVYSVVFSPDGQRLASGSGDNTVKIWDTNSGACLQTLEGHNDSVKSVVFSPDGQRLASGSYDKTVKIWDTNSGAFVFSPDGQRLASGSDDNTVKIWDTNSGACLQTLEGHNDSVYSVVFSPDGQRLASGSGDNTVKIWDTNSGACLQTLEGHNDSVNSVVFSPDGQRLASGSGDKTVKIWDTNSGACLQTLEGHNYSVKSVVFSPDGQRLASGSGDKTVKIWDTNSGACLQTLEGHNDSVNSVVFSPDGQRLASGSVDKTVKIWDTNSGACLQTLEGHNYSVNSVVFSPNGQRLASGSLDKTVKIWDTNSGACLQTLEGHNYSVKSVVFSPDGQRLASGSGDKTVKIWDTNSGACLQTLEGHNYSVNSVVFSPDGQRLASGSLDSTVKIWDTNSGACLQTLEGHNYSVKSVVFSPDGQRLASGSWDNTVKIWDTNSGACLQTLEGHNYSVNSVVFSPDGQRLASGSLDNTVKIWDTNSGACLQTLEGHNDSVNSVVFSPDGQRLASGSGDNTVKIWDTNSGACLQTIYIGQSIKYLKFDPIDNSRLTTEFGVLRIDMSVTEISAEMSSRDVDICGYGISSDGTWITKENLPLVWLPPEYRSRVSAVFGTTVAIGCVSNRVLVMRFS
ncbi:Vegetative incompatibility protein HET-E-1 [Cladobotryum mycophilum]|uniref:Vegetative incompatibility protein HET-E-1 n=1 Tax=Cladobotryum mycophilum TaxID=491253 RepID=A0ABR0T0L6_9HYPO